MRIVAALVLIAAGSLFSYWTFLELFVSGSGTPVEWAFATAFGWLVCHDVWQRFFGRPDAGPARPERPTVRRSRVPRRPPVAAHASSELGPRPG